MNDCSWRDSEVSGCGQYVRFLRYTGLVGHAGETSKMTRSRLRRGPTPYRATERAGSLARAGGQLPAAYSAEVSRRGRVHGVDERE